MVEQLFCNIDDKSVVYRFESELFQVCTYFLVDQEKVIIVDPGKLNSEVYKWLEQFDALDKIIYITHEHFDHHFDVNILQKFPKTSVYLPSTNFKNAINNSRTNISFYYNLPIETECYNLSEINYFELIETPGHSNYSYCFKYKNILFGGDTVIEKKYLVFKLPGGDKSKFEKSIIKINSKIETNTIVLPGHGNLFCYNKWI